MIFKKKFYTFLKWSQKWTKTDMVYLAQNGFWLFLQDIILNSSSFFLTITFANFLSKDTYGTYQFVTSILAILSITAVQGLNTSTIKAIATGYEGTLLASFKIKFKYGIFGFISGLFLSIYYFLNNNSELGYSFLIVSFFVPLLDSVYIYSAFLKGKQKFKKLSQYNVITKIIPTIILILTIILTQNIFLILFIGLTSNIIINSILFYKCIKKFKLNNKIDIDSINLGKHLSLMGILGATAKQLDKLLIFHYLGSVELAIYMIALAPMSKISTLLSKINTLSLPKMSKRSLHDLKKTIPPRIKKLMLILILIVITYIIFIPYFYKIFLPKYIDSIIYSQVFAISLLFFPKGFLSQIFIVQFKKKQLYITNTVVSVLKILLFLIFIPILKIWGVILSLLLIEFIHSIILIIFFKKLKIKYEKNTNNTNNS